MDSFTSALARLDPASRALLDLSLRRGMTPDEIGDLLGTDAESVVAAREAALEQLATELEMEDPSQLDEVRARLAELPAEAWSGTAAAAERPRLEVVKDRPPKRAAEPPAEPRRRSRLPLLLALLAIAAVALVIVLASSGGDNKTASKPKASAPAPAPAPAQPSKPAKPAKKKPTPAAAKPARLSALGTASGATGTAALTAGGQRLTLNASGLAPGAYQVWLYNSVIDAVSLTKVQGTKLSLDLKLPANASHYRYVDVSLEPADGNPNHSGESVLRVPLSKLSR
ncbi:MAG TPA: anti-sigma factor [Beijerinckiaceae bacterium]|nr:anti-sigma factor [Beijerinckiaceae bacterium]